MQGFSTLPESSAPLRDAVLEEYIDPSLLVLAAQSNVDIGNSIDPSSELPYQTSNVDIGEDLYGASPRI